MIKPPPKSWEYILIELEIDEKAVDSRIASQGTYKKFISYLIKEGQTQTLPWAVVISQYKKHKANLFLVTKPILYEEDERP